MGTKYKYLLTVLLAICFAGIANAQGDLITKSKAQKIAEQINAEQLEAAKFFGGRMIRWYRAVNTPGEEQNILDVYGTNAAKILNRYIAFRTVIIAEYPEMAELIPEADTTKFVAQPDGTVQFVAPDPEE